MLNCFYLVFLFTQLQFSNHIYGADKPLLTFEEQTLEECDGDESRYNMLAVDNRFHERDVEIVNLESKRKMKTILFTYLSIMTAGLLGQGLYGSFGMLPSQTVSCPQGISLGLVSGAMYFNGTVPANSYYPLKWNGDVEIDGTIWAESEACTTLVSPTTFLSFAANPNNCVHPRGYFGGDYSNPYLCYSENGPKSRNDTRCEDLPIYPAQSEGGVFQPITKHTFSAPVRYLGSFGSLLGSGVFGLLSAKLFRNIKKDDEKLEELEAGV